MRLTVPGFRIAVVLPAFFCALPGVGQEPAPQKPLTLDDAIRLAEANEPSFAAAVAESRVTSLQRKDAIAGLLPSITAHNQYLYTESNHTKSTTIPGETSQSLPVFIANNTVHEYLNQGLVNETIGLAAVAVVRLAEANAARANIASGQAKR